MMTPGRLHDVVHRYVMTMDAVVAVIVLAMVTAASLKADRFWVQVDQTDQTWPVIALEAVVVCALVLRRTCPVPVLVVTLIGAVTVMLLVKGWSPVGIAVIVAVYTLARQTDRRTTVGIVVLCGSALLIGGAWRNGNWLAPEGISTLAWTGFAGALGQAIQSQKAYVAAVEERARRAEQTREEEARRRVIEERLRIARELHDVVAHHIAVIQVQAGVVDHLLTDRPEAAREALGHVRRSSKMVLHELSGMLDVLRQPDDPITPTDPAPGMDRLVSLIEEFAGSGLHVDWRITGTPQNLPAAVDLVAYRVVQEGLTNAHKHGTGSVELVLGFEPGELMIDMVNRSAVRVGAGSVATAMNGAADAVNSGHGLAGMRERAHAVGGGVSAAPAGDGTWRMTARVPLQDPQDAASEACSWGPRA